MEEIVITLVIAFVLVILVVYLFLQDWRATVIPMLAVPVSLVGTFVVFPLLRFLDQYPFAVRISAGDRSGGGRRHRGGRRHPTAHRRGSVSQGGVSKGDG